MDVPARFLEIRDRIEESARRSAREPGSVRLVAITKTRSVEEIEAAIQAGAKDVGENKVQEAEAKKPMIGAGVHWHLVGHLQKNKAKKAVELFDLIHSLDSAAIGRRLDRLAGDREKTQAVLVQVDLAGEETKFGLPEAELFPTLEALSPLEHLLVEGLMVLPPYSEDADASRPYFRRLRELLDEAQARGLVAGAELSMGMSHDFEAAIEEGATLVRIGTALFGPRPSPVAKAADERQVV